MKKLFSNKKKLCGCKEEVSVLQNVLVIGCTTHETGSVADIEIMRENINLHADALAKTTRESDEINDMEILSDEYKKY